MNYDKLLKQNEMVVVKLWFEKTISDYPSEAAKFIGNVKNRFANPVGSLTLNSLETLFSEIIRSADVDYEKLTSLFDPVLRIRAVQSFSASKSVKFVFSLKNIVHDFLLDKTVKNKGDDNDIKCYLQLFDKRVDNVALVAFDVYVKCREKIFHLKALEERNLTYSAFERAGLVKEIS